MKGGMKGGRNRRKEGKKGVSKKGVKNGEKEGMRDARKEEEGRGEVSREVCRGSAKRKKLSVVASERRKLLTSVSEWFPWREEILCLWIPCYLH